MSYPERSSRSKRLWGWWYVCIGAGFILLGLRYLIAGFLLLGAGTLRSKR